MNCTQSEGGAKVHLSSVAINVNSHEEMVAFIKSQWVKTQSMILCMCVFLGKHVVAQHWYYLAGFTRYLS